MGIKATVGEYKQAGFSYVNQTFICFHPGRLVKLINSLGQKGNSYLWL